MVSFVLCLTSLTVSAAFSPDLAPFQATRSAGVSPGLASIQPTVQPVARIPFPAVTMVQQQLGKAAERAPPNPFLRWFGLQAITDCAVLAFVAWWKGLDYFGLLFAEPGTKFFIVGPAMITFALVARRFGIPEIEGFESDWWVKTLGGPEAVRTFRDAWIEKATIRGTPPGFTRDINFVKPTPIQFSNPKPGYTIRKINR